MGDIPYCLPRRSLDSVSDESILGSVKKFLRLMRTLENNGRAQNIVEVKANIALANRAIASYGTESFRDKIPVAAKIEYKFKSGDTRMQENKQAAREIQMGLLQRMYPVQKMKFTIPGLIEFINEEMSFIESQYPEVPVHDMHRVLYERNGVFSFIYESEYALVLIEMEHPAAGTASAEQVSSDSSDLGTNVAAILTSAVSQSIKVCPEDFCHSDRMVASIIISPNNHWPIVNKFTNIVVQHAYKQRCRILIHDSQSAKHSILYCTMNNSGVRFKLRRSKTTPPKGTRVLERFKCWFGNTKQPVGLLDHYTYDRSCYVTVQFDGD